MYALGASERGFFSLLGVMERGNMLPAAEIRDLTAAANKTSSAMAATAAEVVSMERAVDSTPQSRSYLAPSINAFTAQLSAGVRQYNEMVTAAAHLVSSANNDSAGFCCRTVDFAAALPRRAGRCDGSPGRLGAGLR